MADAITVEHFRRLRPALLEALDHAFFDARFARSPGSKGGFSQRSQLTVKPPTIEPLSNALA